MDAEEILGDALDPEFDPGRAFRFEASKAGRLLWLDGGRIEACLEHARESKIEWLGLDHGFESSDLTFLHAAPTPLRLLLRKPDEFELEALAGLTSLVELRSGSGCQRPLDLHGCVNLERIDLGWCPRLTLPERTNGPLRVRFNRYQPNSHDLTKLAAPTSLVELTLERTNLKSLKGAERFENLVELRVEAHRAMTDIAALANLPALETVELEGVVELTDLSALASLPALRKLTLHDAGSADLAAQLAPLARLQSLTLKSCAALRDLRLLEFLPNLREIRLLDTNILDGDLRPLLPLPIVAVHPNRKHFVPSVLKLDVLRASS